MCVYIRSVFCLLFIIDLTAPKKCVDDQSVSIHPKGDRECQIAIKTGEVLQLTCTTTKNYSYEDINIMHDGKTLSRKVYGTSITTDGITEEGKYTCVNNKTGKAANRNVIFGSPPAEVEDFNCISHNLESLNCSWTAADEKQGNEVTYKLIFDYDGQSCRRRGRRKIYSCVWDTEHQYRPLKRTLNLTLQSENIFGTTKQPLILNHYSVVKPYPPKDLRVLSTSHHSTIVQWKFPGDVVSFLKGGIQYKIEYRIIDLHKDEGFFEIVNTTNLAVVPPIYQVNITDLPYAYMKYELRVSIKPVLAKKDQFWSDYSTVIINTLSESPRRPPDVATGAFIQNLFSDYRTIDVYWKALDDYEKAGADFCYRIAVKENSSVKTFTTTKSGFLILNASLEDMVINIWSVNSNGSSKDYSELFIPSVTKTNSFKVKSFSSYRYENGTQELTWENDSDVDNYTLFWCEDGDNICKRLVNVEVLSPGTSNYYIDLPKNIRYKFAISANKDDRSSGFTWAADKCTGTANDIEFKEDTNLRTNNSVKVTWSTFCIVRKSKIIEYVITYKSMTNASDTKNTTIPPSTENQYVLKNLSPHTTYSIELLIKTQNTRKLNVNTSAKTLQGAPMSPENVKVHNVSNTSLVLSWDKPTEINGDESNIIYRVCNLNGTISEIKSPSAYIVHTLTNLESFTDYSFTVQACNKDLCSNHTEVVSVKTAIGFPSEITNFNLTNKLLQWYPAKHCGGPECFYEIKITKDKSVSYQRTKFLYYEIDSCQQNVIKEDYEVRAVASDNKLTIPSTRWSQKIPITCKTTYYGWKYILLVSLLLLVAASAKISHMFYVNLEKKRDIKPPMFLDNLCNEYSKSDIIKSIGNNDVRNLKQTVKCDPNNYPSDILKIVDEEHAPQKDVYNGHIIQPKSQKDHTTEHNQKDIISCGNPSTGYIRQDALTSVICNKNNTSEKDIEDIGNGDTPQKKLNNDCAQCKLKDNFKVCKDFENPSNGYIRHDSLMGVKCDERNKSEADTACIDSGDSTQEELNNNFTQQKSKNNFKDSKGSKNPSNGYIRHDNLIGGTCYERNDLQVDIDCANNGDSPQKKLNKDFTKQQLKNHLEDGRSCETIPKGYVRQVTLNKTSDKINYSEKFMKPLDNEAISQKAVNTYYTKQQSKTNFTDSRGFKNPSNGYIRHDNVTGITCNKRNNCEKDIEDNIDNGNSSQKKHQLKYNFEDNMGSESPPNGYIRHDSLIGVTCNKINHSDKDIDN